MVFLPEGVFVGSAGSARGTKTEGQDQPRRGTSATSHLLNCVPYGGGLSMDNTFVNFIVSELTGKISS